MLLAAVGCLDDRGTAPSETPTLQLGINAQVIGDARTVEIRVSYRRFSVNRGAVELVRLVSSPERVTVEPGETRVQQIEVLVEPCLNDAQRTTGQSPNGCPIVVELLLLGEGGVVIDNAVIEPEVDDVTQPVTLPPVTLSPPVIVLASTALEFQGVVGGPIPAERSVAITNGGGGQLTGLVASTTYASGTGWLTASVNSAGQLVVRPSTTQLAAGTYQATVAVSSPQASNTPQSVAVTYVVSAPPPKLLTVTGASTGAGRVTSTPPGIDCTIAAGVATGSCSASFTHGTVVALAQTTTTGSVFGGWTGACTSSTTCSVTMDLARNVTASFTLIRHTLTVASGGGTGGGTVTGNGINCTIAGTTATGDCTETFDFGTPVSLTATPGANMTFAGWGQACTGTGACQVTMTSAQSVLAGFTPALRALTVTGGGNGSGSVASAPAGIVCDVTAGASTGACEASFAHGQNVTLTPTASENSVFAGWDGECEGTGPCIVAMTAARSVRATFTLKVHVLTVLGDGGGSGSVTSSPGGIECTVTGGVASGSCNSDFSHATMVTLTAAPAANSAFSGWSGGGCTGTAPCTVPMTQARTVTAGFQLLGRALTVNGAGTGAGRVTSNVGVLDCAIAQGNAQGLCSVELDHGTVVTLTASATAPSVFAGWSGACSGTSLCQVTLDQARTVTARFDLPNHLLSVSSGGGTGSGIVTSIPAGIACAIGGAPGGDCSEGYLHGQEVTLTATASPNNVFDGWGGACSSREDSPTCTLTMDQARSVTATFDLVRQPLTVSLAGNGVGLVISNPIGISCFNTGTPGSDCSEFFDHGTSVRLAATSGPHSTFAGWSGDGCSGTGFCDVTLTQARNVTATFELVNYSLVVLPAGTGSGRVTSAPPGINCLFDDGVSGSCSAEFLALSTVSLSATATNGSAFTGWSGDCSGTGPCTVPMDQSRSVTATFSLLPLPLTVIGSGNGNGSVTSDPAGITCDVAAGATSGDCTELVEHGTLVTLTAQSNANSTFTGWSGEGCAGTGSCQVMMTEARSVTATFTLRQHLLTVSSGGGTGSGVVSATGIDCGIGGAAGTDCTEPFVHGTVVTLTATPTTNNEFAGWGGGVCPGTGACQVTMDQARSITALFTLNLRRLTVGGSGTGHGRVTSLPAGIDCRVDEGVTSNICVFDFPHGTDVTLTLDADEHSTPEGWSDACTSAPGTSCTLTMTQPLTATAHFRINEYPISIAMLGNGSGSVEIDLSEGACRITNGVPSGSCSLTVPALTVVRLTATPSPGSTFAGWGQACAGTTGLVCTVTVNQPLTASATFTLLSQLLTVTSGGGSGSGVVSATGITCGIGGAAGADCTEPFLHGTVVSLTATPTASNVFAGWGGACSGTGPCQVTMDQARNVTAAFTATYRLSLEGAGSGAGTVRSDLAGIDCAINAAIPTGSCSAQFPAGTVVTLSATPGANSDFAGWSRACPGASCAITIDQDIDVTVSFTLQKRLLTVALAGNGTGSIQSIPLGIVCRNIPGTVGSDCTELYDHGTMVRLSMAALGPQSTFAGWSGGGCSGTAPCDVSMTQAQTVTATFLPTPHRLTVTGSGTGHGTVTSQPVGIDCRVVAGVTSGTCFFDYLPGTEVTLSPIADANSNPAGWTGACEQSGGLCVVTMDEPKTARAGFTIKSFNVSVSPPVGNTGNGTVTGGGINCTITGTATSGTCTVNVSHGTGITLTATAGANSTFGGFTGCSVATSPCSVTVTTPTTVTAKFDLTHVPLTINPGAGSSGNGRVTGGGMDCTLTGAAKTGTCSLNIAIGTVVALTATPGNGHTFSGWGGGVCTGTTNPCTVTMSGARTVTATFTAGQYTVTVNGTGDGSGRVLSQPGLPTGIDCTITNGSATGPACSRTFSVGTVVQLTATPSGSGNSFVNFSGACNQSSQPCILPNIPGPTQTVTVRFDFDPCVPVPHAIGERVTNGQISSSFDCQVGTGKYRDSYLVTPMQASIFRADMSGSMPSELRVSFLPTPPGGANGFEWFGASSSGFVSHWILAPGGGNVRLDAVNRDANDFGSYIFSSVGLSDVPVCAPLRTTFGVTNAGFGLSGTDCNYTANLDPAGPDGARAADRFTIFVPTGRSWTVTVTNTTVGAGFQPLIELRDGFDDARPVPGGPERAFIASTWAQTPGNSASLTRSGGGWVSIWVMSRAAGATGTYTITIQ